MLNSLRATQEQERKEVEEQIAEEVCHHDNSKASYQNLIEGLQRSEIVIKTVKGVIANAGAAIVKAQALIEIPMQY